MAQPALGNVYQVRMYCYDVPPTQLSINTTYFKISSVAGLGTMTEQSLCNALEVAWAGRYKPLLSNGSEWYGLSIQRYDLPLPRPVLLFSKASTGAGTGGAGTLPNQVASLVTLKTALAGGHYHGRIYPPFVPLAASDANGLMTAAYAANVQAGIADWLQSIEAIISGGNTCQGLYQVRGIIPDPPPLVTKTTVYNQITIAKAIQKFATQRRRGQYGRTNPLPF